MITAKRITDKLSLTVLGYALLLWIVFGFNIVQYSSGSVESDVEVQLASLIEQPADAVAPGEVWAWYQIGWSAPSKDNRYVGWSISREGWATFIQREIVPYGTQRVCLGNPWGISADGKMRFDQCVMAIIHDAVTGSRLYEDFISSWKVWLDEDDSRELMLYVGRPTPNLDQTMIDAVMSYMRFHPRVSFTFDAAALEVEGSPCHRLVNSLNAEGIDAWIEAWPTADEYSHWDGHKVLVGYYFYIDHVIRRPDVERTETSKLGIVFIGHKPSTFADEVKLQKQGHDVFINQYKRTKDEWQFYEALERNDVAEMRRLYTRIVQAGTSNE